MDDEGNMRYDLSLPDEVLFKGLASRIKTKFEMGQDALVVVMKAMRKEILCDVRRVGKWEKTVEVCHSLADVFWMLRW